MNDFQEHRGQPPDEGESQKKRPLLGRLFGRLRFVGGRFGLLAIGAIALCILVYLVMSADGFVRNNELKKEKARLETEIEVLEDENRILRLKLERLQADPGYVEDEARKKLRLIRPGEIIYRLSEEPDISDQRPPMEPPVIP